MKLLKKIDPASAKVRIGCGYPAPFDEPCRTRKRVQLGDAAGLSQFGVNLLRLSPGAWSSQRHHHSTEDEFVYVLEGEVTLITDAGEELLVAGDSAGFKAGVPDGHHLVNRSTREATVLEVGTRAPATDRCEYPDIDLVAPAESEGYEHRDGSPYPTRD